LPPPNLDLDLSSEDEGSNTPNIPGYGIGMGNPDLLDAQQLIAHLSDLKDTLAAIREISSASLS